MARFLLAGAPAMSLAREFWDARPSRSDEGVYNILAHSWHYVSEVARRELGRRGLDARREREAAEVAVAERREAAEAEARVSSLRSQVPSLKSQARLGDGVEILILSAGVGVLGAVSALYYHWKGYHRKAKDCWLVVSLSVFFHCVLAAVLFA